MTMAGEVVDDLDLDDAGSSSLAYYRQSVPTSDEDEDQGDDLKRCPNVTTWVWLNRATGQVRAGRCGRNACPFCIRGNAWRVAGALEVSEPERWGRFSLVGHDWQTRRNRVKKLTHLLRTNGYGWNIAWHAEPNPRETGYHAHFYQWGSYVPQAHLQELAHKAGMGIPYIEKWEKRPGGGTGYGVKMALEIGYGMKLAQAQETARTYLDANGGRLVHATRGFWRDGSSGKPVKGIKAAQRLWAERNRTGEQGDWVRLELPETKVREAIECGNFDLASSAQDRTSLITSLATRVPSGS